MSTIFTNDQCAKCEDCNNKKYIEATRKNLKDYIEACDVCNVSDESSEIRDSIAMKNAINDGYILENNGYIKVWPTLNDQ